MKVCSMWPKNSSQVHHWLNNSAKIKLINPQLLICLRLNHFGRGYDCCFFFLLTHCCFFRNKASEPQTQSTKKPKAAILAASHINSHSSAPESRIKSPSKTNGKSKKEKVKKGGNSLSKHNEEFFPSSHLSASHASSQSATESILGRTERSGVQQSALIPQSSAQNVPSTPPRSSSVSLSPSRTPKRGNSSSVAPKQSPSVHFSSASLMSSPTVKNNVILFYPFINLTVINPISFIVHVYVGFIYHSI